MSRARLSLTFAFPAAVAIAAGNLFELFSRSSVGRIRDLRVIRLLARLCDTLDINLLALLPRAAHRELDLATFSGSATLFAAAALCGFVVLLPFALVLPVALRRLAPAMMVAILSMLAIDLMVAIPLAPVLTVLVVLAAGCVTYALALRGAPRLLNASAAIAIALVVCGAAAGWFGFTRTEDVRPRASAGAPNIILISIDSLRADHLHAYGYRRETSPNLDRLAAQGALFETVMSPTSWTLPSHMTLLTSLPPERHGVTTNRKRLGRDIPTLPMRLQHAGYYTAGVVSATYLDGLFGFSRGFDEYDDYSLPHASGDRSAKQVSSPAVTNVALQILRRRAAIHDGHPFFLFVHMFDVHYDYNPPEPFAHMFDPVYCGKATGEASAIGHLAKRRDLDHVVALYDGEIAFVDAHIGNILQALTALHLDDNTIVAVVADHGEEFFEHGRAGHFKTLYDEVLHVPLLIRYPGHIPPGKIVKGQVRLMDVPSTLLELAGVRVHKAHSDSDSVSLASALLSAGEGTAPPLPAFGDLNATLASLRTDQGKVIWNLQTNRREFYDLLHDPGEHHAVPGRGISKLADQLERWRSSAKKKDNEADSIELGDEEKSALKSLGYLVE
jgi:arylsulfatase A-like enzyme